jgi:hypothetical protein
LVGESVAIVVRCPDIPGPTLFRSGHVRLPITSVGFYGQRSVASPEAFLRSRARVTTDRPPHKTSPEIRENSPTRRAAEPMADPALAHATAGGQISRGGEGSVFTRRRQNQLSWRPSNRPRPKHWSSATEALAAEWRSRSLHVQLGDSAYRRGRTGIGEFQRGLEIRNGARGLSGASFAAGCLGSSGAALSRASVSRSAAS